jgi:hypothetical protein
LFPSSTTTPERLKRIPVCVWLVAMANEVIKLTYEGDPAFAGFFAHLLREEGLTVDYEPAQPPV